MAWPDQLALAVSALGAAVAGVVLTRSRGAALAVLAEFLTAAGLIRLTAEPTWSRLAAAAVILVVRRVIVSTLLKAGSTERRSPAPPVSRRDAAPGGNRS